MVIRTRYFIKLIKTTFIKSHSNTKNRYVGVGVPLLCVNPFLAYFESPDSIDTTLTASKETDIPSTGWGRLKHMYTYDAYGSLSPQLLMVLEGGTIALLTGFILGGMLHSREALFKFIDENKLTAFEHHLEAKRRLQDKVTVAFAKGGFKLGWRLGLFSTSLLLIITSISTYRGKSSLLEFTLAGGITGAIFKLKQGPKPMVSGGVVGASLGAVFGVLIVGGMKLLGCSLEDIYTMDADRISEHNKKKMERFEEMREKKLNSYSLHKEEITEKMPNENTTRGSSEIPKEKPSISQEKPK